LNGVLCEAPNEEGVWEVAEAEGRFLRVETTMNHWQGKEVRSMITAGENLRPTSVRTLADWHFIGTKPSANQDT
jgi:hypothetical protein